MGLSHLAIQLLLWTLPPVGVVIVWFIFRTAAMPNVWQAQLNSKRYQQMHCKACEGNATLYHAYRDHYGNIARARMQQQDWEAGRQLALPFFRSWSPWKRPIQKLDDLEKAVGGASEGAPKGLKAEKGSAVVDDKDKKSKEKTVDPPPPPNAYWQFAKKWGPVAAGVAGVGAATAVAYKYGIPNPLRGFFDLFQGAAPPRATAWSPAQAPPAAPAAPPPPPQGQQRNWLRRQAAGAVAVVAGAAAAALAYKASPKPTSPSPACQFRKNAPAIPRVAPTKVPTKPGTPEIPLDAAFAPKWPELIQTHGPGLVNEGVTCYLNAVLQALVHSPAFVSALLIDNSHAKDECAVPVGNFCALCALRKMMDNAFRSDKLSARASEFTEHLREIAPNFKAGEQQDAHEFLLFLLNTMQSNCLALSSADTLRDVNPALREQTLIHRLFAGRSRSRVTCLQCHKNQDTFTTFLDLSLNISDLLDLRSALRRMVEIDELRDENKFMCPECKGFVNADKQTSIERIPHVLIVQFNRFKPNGSKITSVIQYDEDLDLRPYTLDRSVDAKYRLDAIISHVGSGPRSGHYYSHVRGPSNKWYKMDDETVSPIHEGSRDLLSLNTAYVLLYTRYTNQAPSGPAT